MTCFFCLKAEARYDGRRTDIQQGANSATMPAKNEAAIDAKNIVSINLFNCLR